MDREYFAQKRKDMEEAFLSLDKEKIRSYMKKYGIEDEPENELVFWAGVHKCITALKDVPEEKKMMSRIWLYSHGFRETFG